MRSSIIVAALCLLWASVACPYTVDQQNDGSAIGGYWSIPNYTPIGQEFRPSFDHIDVAELHVKAMGFSSAPTEFQLDVYESGGFESPLSTSDVVAVTAEHNGPILFTFPGSVPLTPGDLYVLVIRELHGVNWGMAATGDSYPLGQIVLDGEPLWHTDAWFREGSLTVPVELGSWAAIKSLYAGSVR